MKELLRVFGYTKNLRGLLIIVTLLSIVTAVLSLAQPFLISFATDSIVGIVSGDSSEAPVVVLWFAGALLVAGVVRVIVDDVGGYLGDVVAVRMQQQLSNQYYRHLLTLPQRYFDNELSGKIINRLNRAINDITQFVNFFANNLLSMMLTVVISTAVMVWYSWVLALIVVVTMPVYFYLTAKTSVKWQQYEAKKNTHYDVATGRFAEVVNQVRLVKSFNTERTEKQQFARRFSRMIDLTKKQSGYWHKMNAARNFMLVVMTSSVFGVLFYQAAEGQLTIGQLVLLVALFQQMISPMQSMSFFVDITQRAVANSKDYAEAMSEAPEVVDDKNKQVLDATNARVELQNVRFSYTETKQALKDISFVIEPGRKVALVGESGGGKSTILNLLMRLYTPDRGSIHINGVDIGSVTQASLRRSIATVFQDASLFSGTIRENIAYGNPEATDEEVERAARAANAYEFIEQFEKGFATEIGERGIKLSGGQKQRIAIARALLKDAPILLLDEATSSLDSRSESVVQEALERLMKNRTVLIVAHRLSTIANVDTIVTLRDGTVDEVGSPKQLAKTGGIYAQLLELQSATSEKAQQKLAQFDMSA